MYRQHFAAVGPIIAQVMAKKTKAAPGPVWYSTWLFHSLTFKAVK